MPESKVPALIRAIDIIERIAYTKNGISYQELREKTAIPPASLTRILSVLSKRGYLTNPVAGNYRLGPSLYAAGTIAGSHMDILRVTQPVLERLCESIQETVELAVFQGTTMILVSKLISKRSIGLLSTVGYRYNNYHFSGLGKAGLAYLDEDKVEVYIRNAEWTTKTENTITDPDVLRRELAKIRERGYAYDDCENREDVRRFAAPVFDKNERLAGVVSIAGPSFRMEMKDADRFGSIVMSAADEISALLGNNGKGF